MAEIKRKNNKHAEEMDIMNRFLINKKINNDLTSRIRNYLEY